MGVCRRLLLFGLVLWPFWAGAGVFGPQAITGFWQTEGHEAVIRIRAENGTFPGRIVWLAEDHYPPGDPQGMGGQAVVDRHNPDPAKQNRPLIGLQMIKHLDYHVSNNEQARWIDGRIYDSERGKWFDCRLWLADRDHLKVHGYIGLPLLGRTTTWTRVADPSTHPPVGPSKRQESDS